LSLFGVLSDGLSLLIGFSLTSILLCGVNEHSLRRNFLAWFFHGLVSISRHLDFFSFIGAVVSTVILNDELFELVFLVGHFAREEEGESISELVAVDVLRRSLFIAA